VEDANRPDPAAAARGRRLPCALRWAAAGCALLAVPMVFAGGPDPPVRPAGTDAGPAVAAHRVEPWLLSRPEPPLPSSAALRSTVVWTTHGGAARPEIH
jgi:hypothetical protein